MTTDRDPRKVPTYSFSETAHYLRIPLATLRSWLLGQSYKTKSGAARFEPLIEIAGRTPNLLSFMNLIETHVLAALRRKHGISMPNVRRALSYLQTRHSSDRPLADQWFETDGMSLFISEYGRLVNISHHGQLEMRELLVQFLNRVERDERRIPVRLFPFTRKQEADIRLVVIDPRISFGRPVIVGTGVPTAIVAERFRAGDSMEQLADDYGRTKEEIEEALHCEFYGEAA